MVKQPVSPNVMWLSEDALFWLANIARGRPQMSIDSESYQRLRKFEATDEMLDMVRKIYTGVAIARIDKHLVIRSKYDMPYDKMKKWIRKRFKGEGRYTIFLNGHHLPGTGGIDLNANVIRTNKMYRDLAHYVTFTEDRFLVT